MIFKNLSISMKLGFMATTLLTMLAITGFVGWHGAKKMQEGSTLLHELEKQDAANGRVKINTSIVFAGITEFLLDLNITRLTVELDPRLSYLGKMINNDELMRGYEQLNPGFGKIIDKLRKPHDELHASLSKIQETLKGYGGNRSLAQAEIKEIYLTITLPKLQEVTDIFNEAADLVDKQVKEKEEELGIEIDKTVRNIIIVMIFSLFVGIIVSYLVSKMLTTSIAKMKRFVDKLAEGDFSTELDIHQKDEIGIMADALNKMLGKVGSTLHNISSGVRHLSSSSMEMAAVSEQLATASDLSSEKARIVTEAVDEISGSINSISAAMEQSATNTNLVAAATEEMTATVAEIANNANKARGVSETAVEKSKATAQKMAKLGESANRIGKVTETITEISEQTNLLALNATIEAARAGEAGKGFAVVANEIKELAKQTAEATVDIKSQISEMQETTTVTVENMDAISAVIDDIFTTINEIASTVTEQSSATREIADNIGQTSMGIAEVNENVAKTTIAITDISGEIREVSTAASEVNNNAGQVQSKSCELSELAEKLDKLVSRFKV